MAVEAKAGVSSGSRDSKIAGAAQNRHTDQFENVKGGVDQRIAGQLLASRLLGDREAPAGMDVTTRQREQKFVKGDGGLFFSVPQGRVSC